MIDIFNKFRIQLTPSQYEQFKNAVIDRCTEIIKTAEAMRLPKLCKCEHFNKHAELRYEKSLSKKYKDSADFWKSNFIILFSLVGIYLLWIGL